jgi:hypothetical protein
VVRQGCNKLDTEAIQLERVKMPAKSAKQYRFMQAAAHGGLKGPQQIDPSVAKEFIAKMPTSKRKIWSK